MIKTVKINEFKDNKNITNGKKSICFLEPKYIYIPLIDNNLKYNLLISEDDYVKEGQVVAISEKFNIPIHSSISGFVRTINQKMWTNSGKLIPCAVIENDYLDSEINIEKITEFNRENILKRIEDAGIVGMGGAGFPTFIKYKAENIETLIINCCECEPFITCDYRLMLEYPLKLINGIHYALLATNADRAVIAIKKYNIKLINTLKKYCDEKISIFTIKDKYPVGWERYLVDKIIKKKYNKIPSEVNCIVSNASTIVAINDALKHNRPLIERMVTITGYSLKKPINVYCKIGSNISEIIDYIEGLKNKYHRNNIIVGGIMTGKSIIDDNIVVTKTLNSIIINPYLEKQDSMLNCIGCGKCAYICPSKLTPTEIQKYLKYKNHEELEKLGAQNCIQCGLCSYICPSRINLSFSTLKAKEFVLRGRK